MFSNLPSFTKGHNKNINPINSSFGLLGRDFDDFFRRFFNNFNAESMLSNLDAFSSLRVNCTEIDQAIVVEVEIPGMDEKMIDITLENNQLIIRGEKKKEEEKKDSTCHCQEFLYGTFQRHLTIPDYVDASKINAEYRKGILTITLPKLKEKVSKKKISISRVE